MVDDRPQVQQGYYTPQRVSYWVRNFQHLAALADNPSTARNLLVPVPTPESPKLSARQKGSHGDAHRYSDILADLERARMSLDQQSLGAQIVLLVQFGYTLSGISSGNRMGKGRVLTEYNGAIREMAIFLGWEESSDPASGCEESRDF